MPKRAKIIAAIEWVPPPVTKEEALNSERLPNDPGVPPGDGYDHLSGGELPDDYYIDRLVWPHDEGPRERRMREYEESRAKEAEQYRQERFWRSRDFRISEGSVTGRDPGPPSMFNEKED